MGGMNLFDLGTAAKRFRFVAFLEAVSWVFLIIGMVYKRLPEPQRTETPVQIFGMIHGVIFVVFLVVAVLAARANKWNATTTALALVSSIPPFCTAIFELWAARTGKLAELSGNTPQTVLTGP